MRWEERYSSSHWSWESLTRIAEVLCISIRLIGLIEWCFTDLACLKALLKQPLRRGSLGWGAFNNAAWWSLSHNFFNRPLSASARRRSRKRCYQATCLGNRRRVLMRTIYFSWGALPVACWNWERAACQGVFVNMLALVKKRSSCFLKSFVRFFGSCIT